MFRDVSKLLTCMGRTLVIGHKLYDSPMTAGRNGVTQGKYESCKEVWLIVFKKKLNAMRSEWEKIEMFRDNHPPMWRVLFLKKWRIERSWKVNVHKN